MQTFTQFLESKKVKKNYDYSSVLYLLPDKIAKRIYNWGVDNIKDEDVYKDPEDQNKGREDEMHCTVIYGIHGKRPAPIKEILDEVKPFEIKLGKITAFTVSEKYDVIKVDVISKDLHNLHGLIKDSVEVTDSFPDYKPHITIAYLKKGKAGSYVGEECFSDIKMNVDKVVFSSSEGIKTPIDLQ